ncbi:MAG: heme ABC exporter ATP-binding protein CcmA [Candidatus Marinimicrobia bacterium]|nr:heme ABC exporter ATP-binding protein CcmA [Candidatus Neomarinimicrobiota bacterium]MCF7851201.1 heme ABC exporter ATP-binding protein CcmA [Candidatus Neomarinimicrobiota bacterium]MCF7904141.1 heme ABC exporter ATP-binding protein CcmA [Candidatus Neomarinimicrobiota bacterium]
MSEIALHLDSVSKDFGRIIALRGINLDVQPGEFVSILGRNGAGKTTLLNIISGISTPSEGEVLLFGTDPAASSNKSKLAVISHEMFLYSNLTAVENLEYYTQMYRVEGMEDKISSVLETVELTHRRFDLVSTFSRGMMQRLTIARALLHDPQFLLLDEPFTGLDQHAIAMLTTILKGQKAQGRTILLTTHDLHIANDLSDRFVVIDKHRVVYDAAVGALGVDELRSRFFSAEGAQS